MNKKTLIFLLTAAVTASLLAGCGNTAEPVDSGSVVTGEKEADAADAEDAEQEADAADAENAEQEADAGEEEAAGTETDTASEETPGVEDGEQEEEPEEPAEPETVNWLEEHEIAITPQGDSTVNLYSFDSYEEDWVGDYDAGLNVTISETTEGVDEGLKKVVAQITIDMSDQPGNGTCWFIGSFDRYTGTFFRVNKKTKDAIWMGDEYYDIRTEREKINAYPMLYITYAVICPADYDDAVFWIGYWSPEIAEQDNKINYEVRTYTMDELPFYVDGYRCFTLTDE